MVICVTFVHTVSILTYDILILLFDVTCEYDHFIIVMFKKKIKRDQGVLNLNDDEPKIEKKIEQQGHNPTRDN